MVIKWLINNPAIVGLLTVFLMYSDWLLTIAQEKERKNHYYKHYQSYPINTIEGNAALRNAVAQRKWINPKHFIIAVACGIGVSFALMKLPYEICDIFLGYVWGLFLIVDTQHLSNLIGYKASSKGIYGILWVHQRTGFIIQSGRYLAVTIFLLIISILSQSNLIYGITIAGLTSTLRQLLWLRKVSLIHANDLSPNKEDKEE